MIRVRCTRLRWIPLCALVVSLMLSVVACESRGLGSSEAETEAVVLESVEVAGPPDSTLSTARDKLAPKIGAPGVAGALPGGFPKDLPLYQPSSVVDFGDAGGTHYVSFRASDPPQVVRVALLAEWEQAGWKSAGGGSYRRGGEQIRLEISGSGGGSDLRISY